MAAENTIGAMGREAFQRSQPVGRYHARRHEKMNLIRHYDKGMELASKPSFAVSQCFNYEVWNVWYPQEERARRCPIQETVEGYKCSAARQSIRRKDTIRGQTVVVTKSDKQWLTNRVPMG